MGTGLPALCAARGVHRKLRPMGPADEKAPCHREQESRESGAEARADGAHGEGRESPKRKKSRVRPQSKKAGKKAEDLGPHAQALVAQMRDAVASDNKNNKSQKPAVEKMALLDSLYGKLINRKYQSALMDCGVLAAIRTWLEPLPDRSLPNIKIRRSMLEVLTHMKVDAAHLESSQVGKIVNFYSLNPREDRDVRKLARALASPTMTGVDEIEYFEFVPVSIIRELQEDIQRRTQKSIEAASFRGIPCISRNKKHALEAISQSLSRNLFVFQNFVLQTIFSFPRHFCIERKATDLRCEVNVQKLADEFLQIVEEEKYLRGERMRLEGEIEAERFAHAHYERLLLHESDISAIAASASELQRLSAEAEGMCQGFVERQLQRDTGENEAVELRGIKCEMYRKERDELYQRASADMLLLYIRQVGG
ncbi:UNVERIFIED_CONTAM: hypothetical protein PYX00_011277 [Menopon gallinae]|uniref:TFIIS N-terminal domain-containing protein n=1 Tax=Menopon gallinae TaxID=328185 RepID=A0AAW2H723_9NEOP